MTCMPNVYVQALICSSSNIWMNGMFRRLATLHSGASVPRVRADQFRISLHYHIFADASIRAWYMMHRLPKGSGYLCCTTTLNMTGIYQVTSSISCRHTYGMTVVQRPCTILSGTCERARLAQCLWGSVKYCWRKHGIRVGKQRYTLIFETAHHPQLYTLLKVFRYTPNTVCEIIRNADRLALHQFTEQRTSGKVVQCSKCHMIHTSCVTH